EALYLVTGEVEVGSAPWRVPPFRDGTLEEIHVVVVQGQAGGVGGEVHQYQVENHADSFTMKGIDEPFEIGRAAQPCGRSEEADHLVAPRGHIRMLQNAHQLDVCVFQVLDIRD